VLDAERDFLRPATPPCTVAHISWPKRRPMPTRTPVRLSRRSSVRGRIEMVFTKNATEALNIVAYALGG
jgi:hypothetical protein